MFLSDNYMIVNIWKFQYSYEEELREASLQCD